MSNYIYTLFLDGKVTRKYYDSIVSIKNSERLESYGLIYEENTTNELYINCGIHGIQWIRKAKVIIPCDKLVSSTSIVINSDHMLSKCIFKYLSYPELLKVAYVSSQFKKQSTLAISEYWKDEINPMNCEESHMYSFVYNDGYDDGMMVKCVTHSLRTLILRMLAVHLQSLRKGYIFDYIQYVSKIELSQIKNPCGEKITSKEKLYDLILNKTVPNSWLKYVCKTIYKFDIMTEYFKEEIDYEYNGHFYVCKTRIE